MIHILQCLCGPARHTILAIMYRDDDLSPEDAMEGFKQLVDAMVEERVIRQRCEMCDKDITAFVWDDTISKEQDWDKAQGVVKRLELEQIATRARTMARRMAERN